MKYVWVLDFKMPDGPIVTAYARTYIGWYFVMWKYRWLGGNLMSALKYEIKKEGF